MVFKRTDLDTIVVYSSGHVKKIVGEIKFKRIICDTPQNIWASTGADSGLTEEEFRDYFKNKRVAYAIKIDSFIPFKSSKTIQEKYPGVKAPQSFVYLK